MAVSGRTVRTPERGERLLKKLAQGYSVSAACRAERIARNVYYEWRKDEPDFATRADGAIEEGTDALEDVARRRATASTGSDTLLIFLLKARRPEKYREKQTIEHTGEGGGDLVIRYVNDWRTPLLPPPPASGPFDDTTQGR